MAGSRKGETVVRALVLGAAAVIGVLGYHWSTVSSSSATAPVATASVLAQPEVLDVARDDTSQGAAVGEADGVMPDGVTVFDDQYPAVAKLGAALRAALRHAARDAARDGVTFYVESGWRSPAYQEQLLHDAITRYGSAAAAARWVATPQTSAHVAGDAVDVGRSAAIAWLSKHGAEYGLCQIYRNEPWHYELRVDAVAHGCPPMYADAAHDPRMQR